MGLNFEPATPEQARALFDETTILMDRKGHRFVTGSEIYWRGERVTLPPNILQRARSVGEDGQNFHMDAVMLPGIAAIRELVIITFTSLGPNKTHPQALRYKVVPRTSLQDLGIECHEIENLFPRIPSERELDLMAEDEDDSEASGFPVEGLDNPMAFGRAMFESATVNMFRHEIEVAEREARSRALGEFATSTAEAEELIVLVHDFAEN